MIIYLQGSIDQWLDYCITTIDPIIASWLYPLMGYLQYNKNTETKAKGDMKNVLEILNNHLLHKTFMVTERVSLADIVLACTLSLCYSKIFDAEFRKNSPNVTRWYLTVVNQPEFKACYTVEPLCEKMLVYVPPKKEEKAPAPAPKAAEANDEPAPAKKPKNPLDELPPSKMDLDNWKRTYSNYKEKDFYGVMTLFYEQFDPEGYSIYLCDYNFDSENTVGFKTNNLVNLILKNRLVDLFKDVMN